MGYPFSGQSTDTTSAKCAQCGLRVSRDVIVYYKATDKTYLDQGHFGIQRQGDNVFVEDRIFETYCSRACVRAHSPRTVTVFELCQEQTSTCSKGHVLLPETVYYHWRKGKLIVRCKLCVSVVGKQYRAHKRTQKAIA